MCVSATTCRAWKGAKCCCAALPDGCALVLCSVHVASVVQLTHMLMTHGGLLKAKVVDDLTLLASLMAATVHDYGHGGVNNDFLNR